MDWKPYFADRLIFHHDLGFAIIVPIDAVVALPLSCIICGYLLRTRDDEIACRDFGCCDKCAMAWAHPRREEWAKGWRPDPKIVIENVSNRTPSSVNFDLD